MEVPFPKLSTEDLAALYAVGHEFYRNGKYVDALPFFRFLTLAEPLDRKLWIGLGACYQMLKEYPGAIEAYSVAALADPQDPDVHWHAANCFFAEGQKEKAIKTLETAITVAKGRSSHAAQAAQLELVRSRWTGELS